MIEAGKQAMAQYFIILLALAATTIEVVKNSGELNKPLPFPLPAGTKSD